MLEWRGSHPGCTVARGGGGTEIGLRRIITASTPAIASTPPSAAGRAHTGMRKFSIALIQCIFRADVCIRTLHQRQHHRVQRFVGPRPQLHVAVGTPALGVRHACPGASVVNGPSVSSSRKSALVKVSKVQPRSG